MHLLRGWSGWWVLGLWLAASCDSSEEPPAAFDVSAMDRSASPCDDFYQFSCGGWVRNNALDADEGSRATFFEPTYKMLPALRTIMQDAARQTMNPAGAPSPEAALIGSYYQACLDAPRDINSRATLLALATMTDAVTTLDALSTLIAHYRLRGSASLFLLGVGIDADDPSRHVLVVDQGGFELPDRSYYLDPAQASVRENYLGHINRLAATVGVGIDAAAVLRVETALAKAALPSDQRRDPTALHHPIALADLISLAPHFPWTGHLAALGFTQPDKIDKVDVQVPSYLVALEQVLLATPLADLKHYVRWQILEDKAWALDQQVLDEEFQFHYRVMLGISAPQPRWWTCHRATSNALGMPLGRLFVEKQVNPAVRTAGTAMLNAVKTAFRNRLTLTPWMDDATRAEAIGKLDSIVGMVGYPDMWPPLDPPSGERGWLAQDLASNLQWRARQPTLLNQPVDRQQWLMSPIEVNAYYYPPLNEVALSAAIFQLPFFDLGWGRSSRFGAIGAVMGHELTHGFDDSGRHYDGTGKLRPWWSLPVGATFQERAQCMAEQYGQFQALPAQFVNGALTLGENIADLGGVRLAYAAMIADGVGAPEDPPVAGLDHRQQFFVSYAQMYCENIRPELQSVILKTDPHSPGKLRVNGPLSNMPEFAQTFRCAEGTRMRPPAPCEIW